MRTARFLLGTAIYGLFFATFLYLTGFVACLFVPKHLNSPLASGA